MKPVVHHQVEGTLGVKRIEHLLSMPGEWTETLRGSDEALRPGAVGMSKQGLKGNRRELDAGADSVQ